MKNVAFVRWHDEQTVHFMVPLCCGKCEDRVKEKLLDLDGKFTGFVEFLLGVLPEPLEDEVLRAVPLMFSTGKVKTSENRIVHLSLV